MNKPLWPGTLDVQTDIIGRKKQFAGLAENLDSQAFLAGYGRGDGQLVIDAAREASIERLAEAESIILKYLEK